MATKLEDKTQDQVIDKNCTHPVSDSQRVDIKDCMDDWAKILYRKFFLWCKKTKRSSDDINNWMRFVDEQTEKREEDEAGH